MKLNPSPPALLLAIRALFFLNALVWLLWITLGVDLLIFVLLLAAWSRLRSQAI